MDVCWINNFVTLAENFRITLFQSSHSLAYDREVNEYLRLSTLWARHVDPKKHRRVKITGLHWTLVGPTAVICLQHSRSRCIVEFQI